MATGLGEKLLQEIRDPLQRRVTVWVEGCRVSVSNWVIGNPPPTLRDKRDYIRRWTHRQLLDSSSCAGLSGDRAGHGLIFDDAATADYAVLARAQVYRFSRRNNWDSCWCWQRLGVLELRSLRPRRFSAAAFASLHVLQSRQFVEW
jgi:hypothetical protein